MANPSGNNQHKETSLPSHHHHTAYSGGANSVNNPVAGSPDTGLPLHNSGISTDWTPEEQSILEDGLSKYASEANIICFAKIAVQLPNKNVRDVAFRCRWIADIETCTFNFCGLHLRAKCPSTRPKKWNKAGPNEQS